MSDEALADIAQTECIEATRLALEFLLTHPAPCIGDMGRLKRVNMAAYLIVVGLLEGEKEGAEA